MKKDFSQGPVWKIILSQALPLMLAQLIQLLYNVVDRIYIGHINSGDGTALTGIGITFPVITFIIAFAALFGAGGVPLFSISNGAGKTERAEQILGNSFCLLLISSVVLTSVGYIFCRPILYFLGASDESFVYASQYLRVYMAGTVFSMLNTGLNGYISAQGYPKTGMLTVIIGAALNILLDPLFIFIFGLGVRGAALATVISQAVSALWILLFLTGKKASLRLRVGNIKIFPALTASIIKLGTANFVMQGTTCFVQAACNSTLHSFGGDVYVGIMTVLNSIRDIFMLPAHGLISGAQPVMSYNYGAGKNDRVKSVIRFNTLTGAAYTLAAWLLVFAFPELWFRIFSKDTSFIEYGVSAIRIYFFGFVFMSFQFAGQSVFQALGDAKHAIFFSLLRKAVIVIPLTLLLPRLGMGVNGVFIAEPVSNALGGIACFVTMRRTVYRKLV
ncbi:MATE family efflux transporter [Ruminococcus sp.]|uniref:MATE family efflux transporter n=1 Tax=Ruminococcus sp. TaxID=41978 RepID=UPI001B75F332|nr:MATE family efflux transporter [Ruminococcus sp.]MBP5433028.1 MATE family efflux transporter [Ruminococcus sp.]